MTQKLSSFGRRAWPWLTENPIVWWEIAVLVIALAVGVFGGRSERWFRYPGLCLQIAGIATVALGIRATRRSFGQPTFRERVRAWIGRRPAWTQPTITANLVATSRAAGITARGSLSAVAQDDSIEGRIDAVRRDLDALDHRVTQARQQTETELQKQADALIAAEQRREKADRKLEAQLESTATGGLDLSFVGAVWLLFGAVMSTVPQELVDLRSALLCFASLIACYQDAPRAVGPGLTQRQKAAPAP